ncbi:MAG: adenosylmethionine decarboxylase [Moraxellaceae bacterium]
MSLIPNSSKQPTVPTEGIQLMADIFDCQGDINLLQHLEPLRHACLHAVHSANLTIVGERFHQFEPAGVTGVILLAESHVAIHTWPEQRFVSLDIYVCHFSADNTNKAERLLQHLIDSFDSRQANIHRQTRGRPALTHPIT